MRGLIHEMRNQLAVAVANIEAFLDGKLEPTPVRLRAVLQALCELDVLMNALPRSESDTGPIPMESRLEAINVCRLILSETTAIEAVAQERGVALNVDRCAHVDAGCAHFMGDAVRISQVLKNVLLNAIRYTPRGGVVDLDCHHEAGALVFTVTDEGPGIATDERAHIFERGFRGKAAASVPGSGIGLGLVKTFVEAHGGSIGVEPAESGGTTFILRFPGENAGASPANGCAECALSIPPSRPFTPPSHGEH